MSLQSFQDQGLLFNTNFLAETSSAEVFAYRGELVLEEGDIADESNRRKPPKKVLRDAVLLSEGEGLKLLIGGLDEVADLPVLLERYAENFADGIEVMVFAPNAHTECKTEVAGISCYLLPWEAMVWSQVSEELEYEKSDFKGKSAADKVLMVMEGFEDYSPDFPEIAFDEVLANATASKRETHGAI